MIKTIDMPSSVKYLSFLYTMLFTENAINVIFTYIKHCHTIIQNRIFEATVGICKRTFIKLSWFFHECLIAKIQKL